MKKLIVLFVLIFLIGCHTDTSVSPENIIPDSFGKSVANPSFLIRGEIGNAVSSAIFGIRDDATSGFDVKYDMPCPPPPPADWIQLSFPHNWGIFTKWMVDITNTRSAYWTLEVESSLSGLVTLSWGVLPVGLMLKDMESGVVVDMNELNSYRFQYINIRTFNIWIENPSRF